MRSEINLADPRDWVISQAGQPAGQPNLKKPTAREARGLAKQG